MLTELAEYAFAPDGPVQRVLGEHRPIQLQIAREFAAFIEGNRDNTQPMVALAEQRGGLGKTAAYTVVLMLDIAETGDRAAYATFTRGLRHSIMELGPLYNAIVRQTLEANGLPYAEVNIIEVQSPTAVISPSKVEAIRKRLVENKISTADIPEVQEFLDCFDQSERPCEFADLYQVLPSLPCGWTELSLALCPRDNSTEDWKLVQQNRDLAILPRTLILMTHAMVIRNNLRRGQLFADSPEESLGVKTLVVDEADKFASAANTALRFTISRNEVVDLHREVALHYRPLQIEHAAGNQQIMRDSESRLIGGLGRLGELITSDMSYTKDDDIARQMSLTLAGISDALLPLMRLTAETDALMADRIRLCRDNLRVLGRLSDFEHPIFRVAVVGDPMGMPDVQLTLEVGGGRKLMSQMWRDPGFETITMVSALMTNMPPFGSRYDRFRRDIDLDRVKGDRFIERTPLQPSYGDVHSIYVADRVPSLLPTDTEELDLLRVTSLDGLAAQITTAAKRRTEHERMVVLFQSYVAMHKVMDRLSDEIRERVVLRNRRHLPVAIHDLAERPFGIWFGVEWEGINFIHPDSHKTMVNALIITRLPLAPRDEIRVLRVGNAVENYRRGQTIQLFESVHACYRKLYHGVLMGIRSAQDVIDELWILDPRWPLPTHVYQRRPPMIIRALPGRAATLFTNFDRVVEPFDVRHWYKVSETGEVFSLEPAAIPAEV